MSNNLNRIAKLIIASKAAEAEAVEAEPISKDPQADQKAEITNALKTAGLTAKANKPAPGEPTIYKATIPEAIEGESLNFLLYPDEMSTVLIVQDSKGEPLPSIPVGAPNLVDLLTDAAVSYFSNKLKPAEPPKAKDSEKSEKSDGKGSQAVTSVPTEKLEKTA